MEILKMSEDDCKVILSSTLRGIEPQALEHYVLGNANSILSRS